MTEQLNMIPAAARELRVTYLPHNAIYADPAQPRVEADAELRASIAMEGIRQPITVRRHPEMLDSYLIVDGERRWLGAAGIMADVPAIVREDQDDDVTRLMGQLVSNTGKPLTPLEEARAYASLLTSLQLPQAEIADRVGVPRTTFGDRIRLLELGPWIPLIEAGTVPYSMAVEHLVPIRGMPDKYHAQLIEKMQADYRWTRNVEKGQSVMSGRDFAHVLIELARHLFYPLTKTKATYDRQPEFPTSKHDAECSCGGMKVSLGGGDSKRLCCGNPDWWRPLHRKATAAKKKADAESRPTANRMPKWAKVPAEASMRKEKYYYNSRANETVLVKSGKWALDRPETAFDPAVLLKTLAPESIVLIECGYGASEPGGDKYLVVTTDKAAIQAARESYAARWAAKQAALDVKRAEKIEKLRKEPEYKVTGAGARYLLTALMDGNRRDSVQQMHGAATLLELDPPTLKKDRYDWIDGKPLEKWLLSLEGAAVASLATSIVLQLSGKLGKSRGEELHEKQVSEFDALRKHPIAWPGTPQPKGARPKAATADDKSVVDLSEEEIDARADDEDEDLDDVADPREMDEDDDE